MQGIAEDEAFYLPPVQDCMLFHRPKNRINLRHVSEILIPFSSVITWSKSQLNHLLAVKSESYSTLKVKKIRTSVSLL